MVFSVMTLLGVRVYGEIEYYFGMFKFGSLILLFILSIVSNAGGFGSGDYVGFRYWKKPTGGYRSINSSLIGDKTSDLE